MSMRLMLVWCSIFVSGMCFLMFDEVSAISPVALAVAFLGGLAAALVIAGLLAKRARRGDFLISSNEQGDAKAKLRALAVIVGVSLFAGAFSSVLIKGINESYGLDIGTDVLAALLLVAGLPLCWVWFIAVVIIEASCRNRFYLLITQ